MFSESLDTAYLPFALSMMNPTKTYSSHSQSFIRTVIGIYIGIDLEVNLASNAVPFVIASSSASEFGQGPLAPPQGILGSVLPTRIESATGVR